MAVKVTLAPGVEGFRLDTSVLVGAALVEDTDFAAEVLVLLAVSPAYTAVRLLVATVVKIAV